MGITYGMLLNCHGVAERNVDKNISTLEYINRTVCEWFDNPFIDEFSVPSLHIPPITIYDRPRPHKRAQYPPYLLPAAIYIASVNYVITLTTPDLLPSNDPNTLHVMKKYVTF